MSNKIELIATFPIYKPFRRINENFRNTMRDTLIGFEFKSNCKNS